MNGTIRMIPFSDLGVAIMTPNTKIVSISDTDIPNCPTDLKASILLPPYEAMCAKLDNNIEMFQTIYTSYLETPEVKEYILAVILAMMQGRDILFVLGPEESNMDFPIIFFQHIQFTYGIMLGTSQTPSVQDFTFYPRIITELYIYGLIDYGEFFFKFPKGIPIEPIPALINKLIMDMRPYVEDRSYNGYLVFFNNYKESLNNGSRNLQNPFTMN